MVELNKEQKKEVKEDKLSNEQVHEMVQEEAKKEIEKLGTIEIELHPAGGFDKKTGFVYEPLGKKMYLFKFKGYKGIGAALQTAKAECPSCGTTIKQIVKRTPRTIKCSCGRILLDFDVNYQLSTLLKNLILIFKGVPLDRIIFKVPRQEAVDYWLKNFLVDKDNKEINERYIFDVLKRYFKAFYDLPFERSYDMLALAAFESWLVEMLNVLYYVSISGETGSGKTALQEALADICRHGLLAANIKSAGIARCAEKYKLSLCIDEIDAKKFRDDDVEGICRQGYRRGQLYVRMMPKTHEPEFFDVFGFKNYSYRSGVADDLQNRAIDIPISRTKNKEIPIINLFKQYFSPYEMLFFWYLNNASQLYTKTSQFQKDIYINNVNSVNKVNTVNVNSNLYNIIDRNSIGQGTPYLLNFINLINEKPIFGRNIEIAYLIYSLTQILSLDINKILVETIEEKQEIEEASQEEGWIGLLRELLAQGYEDAEIKDGIKVIAYKNVIGKYLRRMKEVYDNIPSQHQIKRLLRQIGFIDNINRKVVRLKDKTMLCLIYDNKIKESLGIKEEQEVLEEKTGPQPPTDTKTHLEPTETPEVIRIDDFDNIPHEKEKNE